MSVRLARSWRKGALAATAIVVAAAGLVHAPFVRRLLGADTCPWEGRALSAEKLEDLRQKSAASLRTTRAAAARPAFGFTLDRTTKGEVFTWAGAAGLACREELGGAAVRCERGERGDLRDVFFRFDPRGALVAVDAVHIGTSPGAAAERARSVVASIERAAGSPTATRGEPSEAHLGAGRLSQAATEFRFSDYAADVVATSFTVDPASPDVVVREQYRSLTATR